MLGLRDRRGVAVQFSQLSGLIVKARVYTAPGFTFLLTQNSQRFESAIRFCGDNAVRRCVAFMYVRNLCISRVLQNFGFVSDTKTDLMTLVALE
jgi:hypothetical protein